MRKVVLALSVLVAFVVLVYGVVILLAGKGREEIAERWRTLGSDEQHAAKFPEVREKNEAAAKLEAAAIPLDIGMMPRTEMDEVEGGALDQRRIADFKKASDDWVKAAIESGDDTIPPPPPVVASYLGENRVAIDGVVDLLSNGEPPLWTMRTEGPAMTRPIPNLLGQMQLAAVLGAAGFEAELAGDHVRAWRTQHALWTLAKGTLSRPEMICQLIGVALTRRVAGVTRKLEGPAPAWFAELEGFDFHRAMIDSSRSEWTASSEALNEDNFLEELRASARPENAHLFGVVRDVAIRPFIRWGITEMERATVEELVRLEKVEPCGIDSAAISAAIGDRLPTLARKFGGDFLPSTHTALSRAASLEIAIEGSSKILALKSRRDAAPDRAWPDTAADLAASRCSDARWNYARAADGSMRFAFDGKVDRPAAYQGHWVPLEYRQGR